MKDITEKINKPILAKGRVIIDLTDPLTGKIKEQIKGDNHVFAQSLYTKEWRDNISVAYTVLTDSVTTIDPNFPLLLGQAVGYGRPSLGTLNTYRGAYNAANQVINEQTLDKVRWKFQYDFTAAQANGVAIGTVGITNQYYLGAGEEHMSSYLAPELTNVNSTVNDGRYVYFCTASGIISKYDTWASAVTTINVSATVGTLSTTYKIVGFDPVNNKYFIFCASSTAGDRVMHKFSDSTFSEVGVLSYTQTNIPITTSTVRPIYVCDNMAYYIDSTTITTWNYVDDVAPTTVTVAPSNASNNESASYYGLVFGLYSCPIPMGKYLVTGGGLISTTMRYGRFILDLTTGLVVGQATAPFGLATAFSSMHPISALPLPCFINANNEFRSQNAITGYLLETPITKTSANGMTVTYELEVNW